MTGWDRWLRQTQSLWTRRAVFQVHLWCGIAAGIYILVICMSGSILVYRNELYDMFLPQPQDIGQSMPAGMQFTMWLLDLHDNLLYGHVGRRVNAIGALLITLIGVSGAIVWWPGIRQWRRSLTIDARAPWTRLNWSLHSTLGFWFLAFVLMWGLSGFHLSFPRPLDAVAERFETLDESNPARNLGDKALYWLTYSHFGRFAGRIPGCGSTCGAMLKAAWAVMGLVPVLLFVTGVLMWWNRVMRRSKWLHHEPHQTP